VKALGNIMNKLKNKRVVLIEDFNSTETKSSYDIGGPLPPTNTKNTNAATIQTILDTYNFKDLWIHRDNDAIKVWDKNQNKGQMPLLATKKNRQTSRGPTPHAAQPSLQGYHQGLLGAILQSP
jgi:hypothetical protein